MKKTLILAFVMVVSYVSTFGQQDKLGTSGKYVAFLVGANDYEEFDNLKYPIQDVGLLKETLKDYSFKSENIITVENPTDDDFFGKINDLKKKVNIQDNLLVYISMHGFLHDQRKYYWLPINAKHNRFDTWIYVEKFLDELDSVNCKHILLIVDSCFGGNVYKVINNKSVIDDVITEEMISKYKARRSAIAITSGTKSEKVPDASHFFKSLNYVLKSNDNMFLPAEVFYNRIKKEVYLEQGKSNFRGIKIDPQYAKIAYLKDDDGQFVFLKKNGIYPKKNTDEIVDKPVIRPVPEYIIPINSDNNMTKSFKLSTSTHSEIFNLNKGDKLKVEATGAVTVGMFLGTVSPRGRKVGIGGFSIEKYNIARGLSHGSVIYRLGANNPWQECGDGCEIIVPRSGEITIEFTINDNNVGDNSGEFQVTIKKQ